MIDALGGIGDDYCPTCRPTVPTPETAARHQVAHDGEWMTETEQHAALLA
jgi:hypothetical protein